MNCRRPVLHGFTIELPEVNLALNVQDLNGNPVEDADVTITCPETRLTGKTDGRGCFEALLKPRDRCILAISGECYRAYSGRFFILPESELNDAGHNLIFQTVDPDDQPVADIEVYIRSDDEDQRGRTDQNGIFEGTLDTGQVKTLTMTRQDFRTYQHRFHAFTPMHCRQTGFRVVPILRLTPREAEPVT